MSQKPSNPKIPQPVSQFLTPNSLYAVASGYGGDGAQEDVSARLVIDRGIAVELLRGEVGLEEWSHRYDVIANERRREVVEKRSTRKIPYDNMDLLTVEKLRHHFRQMVEVDEDGDFLRVNERILTRFVKKKNWNWKELKGNRVFCSTPGWDNSFSEILALTWGIGYSWKTEYRLKSFDGRARHR
jgi:hypothetical protein